MEEGGLPTSAPSACSAEIAEQEYERGLGELPDRVDNLKLTGDINKEVESRNKLEGMVIKSISDGECVSYSGTASDPSSTLLSGYLDVTTMNFTSVASFRKTCVNVVKSLSEGVGCPYVAFCGVFPMAFERIEGLQSRSNSSLPRMSFLYDMVEESLVVKLIPSAHHDRVTMEFMRIFEWNLGHVVYPTLAPMGPFKCKSQNGRSKEPDHSYKPSSRVLASDWPSFVVEVGLSESLSNLRQDLAFWLIESEGQTRVAVLLDINRVAETIYIESWEVVSPVQTTRIGANYDATIRVVEEIMLHRHVPYNGPCLLIPAHLIYDMVPPIVPAGAFLLGAQDLEGFKNRVWATLG